MRRYGLSVTNWGTWAVPATGVLPTMYVVGTVTVVVRSFLASYPSRLLSSFGSIRYRAICTHPEPSHTTAATASIVLMCSSASQHPRASQHPHHPQHGQPLHAGAVALDVLEQRLPAPLHPVPARAALPLAGGHVAAQLVLRQGEELHPHHVHLLQVDARAHLAHRGDDAVGSPGQRAELPERRRGVRRLPQRRPVQLDQLVRA